MPARCLLDPKRGVDRIKSRPRHRDLMHTPHGPATRRAHRLEGSLAVQDQVLRRGCGGGVPDAGQAREPELRGVPMLILNPECWCKIGGVVVLVPLAR